MNVSFRHHGRTIRGDLVYPNRGRGPFPAVLFVHGRGSDRRAFVGIKALQAAALRQGAAVFRIDLSGHGQSDGAFADVTVTRAGQDVAAAVEFLSHNRRINPSAIAAVGHSMGGTAILVARAAGARLKSLVLLAPVGDTQYHAKHRYTPAQIREWRRTGWQHWTSSVTGRQRSLRYGFFRDLQKIDTLKLSAGNHQPVLLVHGDQDRSVPLLESRRLMNVFDHPKALHVVTGADHNFSRPSDQRTMVRIVTAWLKRYHTRRQVKSVVVLVIFRGKLLALKRSDQVWYYQRAWALVGGHLPDGINPLKHAYEELQEEIGIRRSDVRRVRVGKLVRIADHNFGKVWLSRPIVMELKRRPTIRLDWEHTAWRWVEPKQFPFHQSYTGIKRQFAAVGLL